jgi:hypothetical protein
MRVIIIKSFEVWKGKILKPGTEIIDIDDPIAKRAIMNGYAKPVEKEDIEKFKNTELKKVKTKNKKEETK